MAKSDHSMFSINKDLLVYKAFYFFFMSGFGSVFPYLPVYFRQIGLTADQVGLIVGMRPIVQFASAPFWAVMADKYKKRKAVLVMSVLSWLIMTLALAFVEPTNEICEFRMANNTHTHFVNYTKVKTGFFRRSLKSSPDRAVQENGKDIEASPDLVVVPMEIEAESHELGSGSGDHSSTESFQLFQNQKAIRSGFTEEHTQHIDMFSNSSKTNDTLKPANTEMQHSNKTFIFSPDSTIIGNKESGDRKLLEVNVNEENGFDKLNNSATRWTNNTAHSLEQLVRKLHNSTTALSAEKELVAMNKSHDKKIAAKYNDTFNRSEGATEGNDENEQTFLDKSGDISEISGSGQTVEQALDRTTKSKRHDMTKAVATIVKAKEGDDDKSKIPSKGSSIKKKKSAPVVFDFSQFLPEVSKQNLQDTVNASWQTIGFQSHSSKTEPRQGSGSTFEQGSGEEGKKLENGTNNNNSKSYDINKDKITDMKKLSKIYAIDPKANISIFAFENVENEIKKLVPTSKNISNNYINSLQKHVSETKANSTETANSSNYSDNLLPAAKLTLQATLTGTDHLHEEDVERTRGEMLHRKEKFIPYSAFQIINTSDGNNNSSLLAKQSESNALKISQFLFEKPMSNPKEDTWTDISGENSGFSEATDAEFSSTTMGNRNSSTESPTHSLSTADTLQQLKVTTKNLLKTNPFELKRIFIILMILIVVGEFLESPAFTLADAALLEHLGEERRYYGKQRLWGSLGFGIFSFIVGILLEKSRHMVCGEPYTDYMICFCVFAIIMVLTLFTSTKFQFEYNSTSHAGTSVLSALCNVHYCSCLIAACFMGFGHGMSHNFINWFLEDLGGSKTLMGVAVICRSLADLTMFFVAGFVIKLVGQIKMMCMSLFCYGVIFTSYSMLENSWSVLPIELLNGITYAAAWSACTSYMAGASTADAVTTIQGKEACKRYTDS